MFKRINPPNFIPAEVPSAVVEVGWGVYLDVALSEGDCVEMLVTQSRSFRISVFVIVTGVHLLLRHPVTWPEVCWERPEGR